MLRTWHVALLLFLVILAVAAPNYRASVREALANDLRSYAAAQANARLRFGHYVMSEDSLAPLYGRRDPRITVGQKLVGTNGWNRRVRWRDGGGTCAMSSSNERPRCWDGRKWQDMPLLRHGVIAVAGDR